MLIGAWDIKEAGARQHRVSFENHSITNNSEWIKGDLLPTINKNTIGFQSIKTVLIIKGNSRKEILEKISQILAHCLESSELSLDGYANHYIVILKKYATEEASVNRWHLLTLEWEGYEVGDLITKEFGNQTSIVIENPGNIVAPMKISIHPTVGVSALIIKGISRNIITDEEYDVVIRNTGTDEILLDGETGLITQNGALKSEDIDIWELPSLKSGKNTIELSHAGMKVTVLFRPRYM